jgi:predicted ATPase
LYFCDIGPKLKQAERMSDFFEHGSRWVRADFHLHTAAADEFNKRDVSKETYVQDFVHVLDRQGIQLAVVTNHNKFDKDEFLALKAEASDKDIYLVAGVEFSAKDGQRGIHILIVFEESWYEGEQDNINSFLRRAFHLKAGFDKPPYDVNSDYGLCEAVQELNRFGKDYFLVMAHVDHKNGLLEEVRGRNLSELVNATEFKSRVLAFQKSAGADKRRECERLMDRTLALVEGSDNAEAGMGGVGICNGNDRKCYLKLGAFTFEAVKFALAHHEERVSASLPPVQDLYISAIEIERGAEAAVKIPLSPDLNTLIGVRGSGKSSLLEAVRFGLGLEPNETPKDYKNEIVRRFLDAGNRLLLHLADADGNIQYTIRREWGKGASVWDATGQMQSGLQPLTLLPAAYYGQKDIEDLGKNFNAQYVEDKLLKEQLTEAKTQEAEIVKEAERIFNQLQRMADLRGQQEEIAQQIACLEQAITAFESSGLQELVAKELNFADDESKLIQIGSELSELAERLLEVIESYGWESYLSYEAKEAGNAAFFKTEVFPIIRELVETSQQLSAQFSESAEEGASIVDRWAHLKHTFSQLRESLQEEFRQAKQRIDNPNVDVDTHKQNKQTLHLRKAQLKTINAQLDEAQNLEEKLTQCLENLEAHRQAMFGIVQKEIQKLNDLKLSFRIEVTYQGDKDEFKNWLAQNTSRLHKENHARRIAEHYDSPVQIYRDLNQGDTKLASILSGGSLLPKFREVFRRDIAMLTYRVPDKYVFYYNDKPLERYSIGQKSTALIAFVLAHEDKRLFIIDQPEDDLDNYTVAKEIIGRIKQLKPSTQFIFATHNPNILVLGDSEQVVVCQYHDDEERFEFRQGSIDSPDVQQTAINIMEGGQEAFDRRKNVYQLWKH